MKKLDIQAFGVKLVRAADAVLEVRDLLCQIDSKFGDGDHGFTMQKISEVIKAGCQAWQNESVGEFLDALGTRILGVNGGSAGPLWGTVFQGLAIPVMGRDEVSADDVKAMFAAAVSEMEDISTARVGDKTMMDALIPAAAAAQGADGGCEDVLRAAASAALAGAAATEGFIAKYGRAKSYKEQTIGTPDAGAVSLSTFLSALPE